MANEIQVLKQTELLGQRFYVYGTPDEPLFLAKDVAAWIEHSNVTEMLRSVDDDEKLTSVILRAGQNRECNFLTEGGLYEVLMQSRKPIAKEFKKGVKAILHEIRTKGGYMVAKVDDTPEEIMARALLVAQETLKRKEQQLLEAESKIAEDAPKVNFANAVIASNSSCLIGELAKILTQNGYEIGQNRFFEWLRENGYLGKHGERRNIPNQQYIEQVLFELKKGIRSGNDGVMKTTITPKVTTKGQVYFINKFINA